jgi:Family of unknown function (DUF5412)
MPSINKKVFWAVGILILIPAAIYLWSYAFDSLGSFLCDNEVIETKGSPDGQKKAVVFVKNCGATTDWMVEASILNNADEVNDRSDGNALKIDADHGKAWPLGIRGWPIITLEWKDEKTLILHYSKDSRIYEEDSSVEGVSIQFAEITRDFVEHTKLEIR